jgi:hypothetical protein
MCGSTFETSGRRFALSGVASVKDSFVPYLLGLLCPNCSDSVKDTLLGFGGAAQRGRAHVNKEPVCASPHYKGSECHETSFQQAAPAQALLHLAPAFMRLYCAWHNHTAIGYGMVSYRTLLLNKWPKERCYNRFSALNESCKTF